MYLANIYRKKSKRKRQGIPGVFRFLPHILNRAEILIPVPQIPVGQIQIRTLRYGDAAVTENPAEGVFAPLLKTADIVADGGIQNLSRLGDARFFQTPAFKKTQSLLIALHGLGPEFPTPAVVHVLVDVKIKVPDKPFFLHKKCPRFIED